MKGMFQKILFVWMAVAMLAVLLPVSALAAADITVNCMDLTTALADGNGVGFHDTSPDGLDNTWFKTEFSPIEVDNSYNVLLMRSTEWVRYQVTVAEAGFYSIGIDYAFDQRDSISLIVRTDDYIETVSLAKTASLYSFVTAENLGCLYLTEGTNNLYVFNESGTHIHFRNLFLTKDSEADWEDITLSKQATDANEELSESAVTVSLGRHRVLLNGNTISYDFDIKKDGKYRVKLLGTAVTAGNLQVDFDGNTPHTQESALSEDVWSYAETDMGVFALYEGMHTLTLSGAANYYLSEISLEYIGSYLTELQSASVTENSTIPRGTDAFTFVYNDLIDEVAPQQVIVSDGTSNLMLETKTEENKLMVYLTETLEFGTSYTITLQGVKGIYDEQSAGSCVISFATSDASLDDGTASLTVTEADNNYEVITVSGTVFSGAEKGISGRTVELLSSNQSVASCVSGEGGVFTLNYTMPQNSSAQLYHYSIKTDYATEQAVQIYYINRDLETEILSKFASSTDETSVSNIFRTHRQDLGFPNYVSDLRSLSDRDLFFGHFVGKSFSDAKTIREAYTRLLALERLNQATDSAAIKAYLTDEDICNTIGLDGKRFLALGETIDSLISEYLTLPVSQTETAFLEKCNTLLEKWLKTTYQKSDVSLQGNQYSITVGQALSVPVSFVNLQSDVKQVKLKLAISDSSLLSDLQLSVDDDATITSLVSGNVLNAVISYETPKAVTTIAQVGLTAPAQKQYTLMISGTLEYEVAPDVMILVNVNEASNSIAVSQSIQSPPKPATGGGGGGGGFSPAPSNPVNQETQKAEENASKNEPLFTDLKDAAWAESMIISLTNRGIISKSAEGKFRPTDSITREEYVKLIVMASGCYDSTLRSSLSDVPMDSWANAYIASAEKNGIVLGNDLGTFGLGEDITRQDMAVILYRVFQRLGTKAHSSDMNFSDKEAISEYAYEAVNALGAMDIISGMGDNTFQPQMTATRAQAAKMIYKMMEVLGL